MPGFPDYYAQRLLNDVTGAQPISTSGTSRYLGLWTTAPTGDAGATGATEVSGAGYARVQVAGALTAASAPSTGSATFTLASTVPAWLLALGTNGSGCNVYDLTNGKQIGTVSSISGTTVTLTGNAANNGSGASDSIQFSAFGLASASSGAEPGTTAANATNGAQINFAQATGTWGSVPAWFLNDALTSGNYLFWDYLGNYAWQAASVSSASPGVFTSHAHGLAVNDNCVVSVKAGGALPGFAAGNFTGPLTVAHAATDTFDVKTSGGTAVNTNATGDVMFRKITGDGAGNAGQSIPANVTFNIPAGNAILAAA
jgi:hypothetical protein